jgi:hypothetical protein
MTGEIEYLITNIEDFSYKEITRLYQLRWDTKNETEQVINQDAYKYEMKIWRLAFLK